MKVKDILETINGFAPFDSACAWDNCGLLVGDKDADVTGIYLTLDADKFALCEAKKQGCNLVVSHHPIIFSPLSSVTADTLVFEYIKEGISVISVHTPLDMAKDGVNDCLARACHLENVENFILDGAPLGRVGFSKEKDGYVFADAVKSALSADGYTCIVNKDVSKVCTICGSGGSAVREAFDAGCDTIVTGEAKHDAYLTADSLSMNIFVFGHFETENIVLSMLYDRLFRLAPCFISTRKKLVERR